MVSLRLALVASLFIVGQAAAQSPDAAARAALALTAKPAQPAAKVCTCGCLLGAPCECDKCPAGVAKKKVVKAGCASCGYPCDQTGVCTCGDKCACESCAGLLEGTYLENGVVRDAVGNTYQRVKGSWECLNRGDGRRYRASGDAWVPIASAFGSMSVQGGGC